MGKRVILVSHNHLAEGMAGTVKMIFGETGALSFFCLEPTGSVVELGQAVKAEVEAHPADQAVVIADILGGSVCNQCLQDLYGMGNVKIVAGMSLPLVLSILSCDGELTDADLQQAVDEACACTQVGCLAGVDDVTSGEEDFF